MKRLGEVCTLFGLSFIFLKPYLLTREYVAGRKGTNYYPSMFRCRPLNLFFLVLAFGQPLSMTPAQANASQKMSYTFNVSFDNSYAETSSFRFPAKINKAATQKLITQECQSKVNKQPRVTIRSASGKIVGTSTLNPNHSIKSATWIKDGNGENIYRVMGSCSYTGLIPRKYAASNFYQFSADPQKIMNWQTWSYPYTSRHLANLKSGITETRVVEGNAVNAFLPYPEIETPKVAGIRCLKGTLDRFGGEEEPGTENVEVAYFDVLNPVYKKNQGEVNWPEVWLSGDRQPNAENYQLRYFEPLIGGGALVTESPAYVVWKKPQEKSFEIDLKVSVYTIVGREKYNVVNEKTYALTISGDCKMQSLSQG